MRLLLVTGSRMREYDMDGYPRTSACIKMKYVQVMITPLLRPSTSQTHIYNDYIQDIDSLRAFCLGNSFPVGG
jgi:hypothetical protein